MLSTTFNRPTELQIELPEVTQKTTTNEQSTPPSINVKLDQHGHCFINQQTIKTPTATNLEPLLRQLSVNRSDIPVEIEADARTPHQAVITVMDAARRAGLLQIAFTAMQEWQ
jgi:biopolymer transport protein ExbD